MISLLESAVRASTGGGVDEQLLLEHLDVRMHHSPGGTGWECFCLDYCVAAPVSVVFSAEAMGEYRQVFNFLPPMRGALGHPRPCQDAKGIPPRLTPSVFVEKYIFAQSPFSQVLQEGRGDP